MEKTIKLGEKDVKLNNSVGWALIYRDQFGHDVIPTLMPLLVSTLDVIGGLITEAGLGSGKSVEVGDVASVIGSDAYVDAMVHLSGIELVEIMYITWAMAKNADRSLDDPETWIRSLDSFPIDEVAPILFQLIAKGFMSSKNVKRLQALINGLKPSVSTTSSSEALSEA